MTTAYPEIFGSDASLGSGALTRTPIALTIAGSDSGGGAGVQADLKTFSALGVYGASVITALTAQNTRAVKGVLNVPPDFVVNQLETVLEDLDVSAIKIGMLSSVEIIEAVARVLRQHSAIPVVLDPVMVAKSGDRLLSDDAHHALLEHLCPLATVLTPNVPEAAVLLDVEAVDSAEALAKQAALLRSKGCDAVLMKGGHLQGELCVDLFYLDGGLHQFKHPRIRTNNTHGTGCTLSSAIAAGLAKGDDLLSAVGIATDYVHGAILAADELSIGSGHGPVHHFYLSWPKAEKRQVTMLV